jgi:hypothetical protein
VSVSLDDRTVTSPASFVVIPGGTDPSQPADTDPNTAPIPPAEAPLDDPDVPDDDPSETPTVTGFAPASGPVGTSVVLSGTGLGEVVEVVFGGDVASLATGVTDTSLTTTVPEEAEDGPITVVIDGRPISSTEPFEVVSNG